MALQFKSLKLPSPDLFGVSLSGSVGRGDRDRLKELADKCLKHGKTNVLLDLSELGSMGGGGARMIAELQERLEEAQGGALIAGAGPTVQRFLDQKLQDRPLTYYASVREALQHLGVAAACLDDAPAEVKPREAASGLASPDGGEGEPVGHQAEDLPEGMPEDAVEVGAVAFFEDDDEAELQGLDQDPAPQADDDPADQAAGSPGLDNLLDEFTVAESRSGRRKDHHFASLSETLEIVANWSGRSSPPRFAEALKNLLFSQGLAEDVTLLTAQAGLLVSSDGYKEIPLDGSLALQVEELHRPVTMLDLNDDELCEEEISLLEIVNPDMIIPVLRRDVLTFLIMVKKGGEDRDFSVPEAFAFELLQQILEDVEEAKLAAARLDRATREQRQTQDGQKTQPVTPAGEGGFLEGILLRMALDLPEADDLPHFWRLFAHHLQPEMELEEMAFLAANRPRPQIMLGGDNSLLEVDCSDQRLVKFFQGMEMPVHVDNLPGTFAELQADLRERRVRWIIPLRYESDYLGVLFVNGTIKQGRPLSGRLQTPFNLAGRLLARFEVQNDDADIFLDLILRIMSGREKRVTGSDSMIKAMVQQLSCLAEEMGFPPDQKRDLIYGCLLRDIGLVEKDDTLMGSPADMTPAQWKTYRNHPSEGAALLASLQLSQTVLEVVKCHHERFNGEGFPAGLSGRDIPLAARVVTVVENYVAMITGAGGLEPRTPAQAAQVLRENLGDRYDPDIVGIFLSTIKTQK
jgi:anti-anti-sigma regulatory factor